MSQQIVILDFNECCKHFGDRTVNNQTCQFNSFGDDVDRSRHKGLSAVVDKSRHLGVSAVTCSSRRQKSPRKNDSQIVKYKNIFSTRQKVKKKLLSTKRVKLHLKKHHEIY